MTLRLGVDCVEIAAFRARLACTPRLRERLFRPAELARAAAYTDPVPHLAAWFAAKEAAAKALGTGFSGAVRPHDIEIAHDPAGAPSVRLARRVGVRRRGPGARPMALAITHSPSLAVAVVAAMDRQLPRPRGRRRRARPIRGSTRVHVAP